MGETADLKNVTKFNGQNFQLWKFQMKTIFIAHDLLKIVEGTEAKPEATGDDQNSWIKKNAKAMFILSSSMEYSQLEYLITCATATEMWVKLSAIHEQKSALNKLALTTKFHEYRLALGDSIVQHIAKIENMANQLKDIDENVSDVMIMAKILGTLPTKYSAFASAWDSVAVGEQTLPHLRERLIREESRMTTMDEVSSALATSVISTEDKQNQRPSRKNDNKAYKKKIVCNFCNKTGHIAKYCFARKRASKAKDKNNVSTGNECKFDNSNNQTAFIVQGTVRKLNNKILTNTISHEVYEFLKQDEKDIWFLDSGASRHLCCRKEWFSEIVPCKDEYVCLGDNTSLKVEGQGKIFISRLINNNWLDGEICNVSYVPLLKKNLFSTGICTSKGFSILLTQTGADILAENKEIVARGIKQKNELIRLLIKTRATTMANYASTASLKVWHERLGHINCTSLTKMVNNEFVNGICLSNKKGFFCRKCPLGKQARFPFRPIEKRSDIAPGEIIHADLCGPMQTVSIGGAKFFLLLKDECSNYRTVYFLKHKNDVFDCLKEFVSLTRNQFEKNIKILRTDNGTEFTNSNVRNFLKQHGIKLLTSAPYTPEQNGRAEREMRTIVESARSMLFTRNLPKNLWGEAVNTAVYILNRTTPLHPNGKTPIEIYLNKKPNLSHIKTFGCNAYVHVPDAMRKKWDPKSKNMIFIGYEKDSDNYRLLDCETKRITISRNVIFDEEISELEDNGIWISIDNDTLISENEIVHRNLDANDSTVSSSDSDNYEDANNPISDETIDDNDEHDDRTHRERYHLRNRENLRAPERYAAYTASYNVPVTYKEAVSCENSALWKIAIEKELKAHQDNKTWKIVSIPENYNLIGCKWVFKIKESFNENTIRYKARLCAQGFSQNAGIDYNEVFSPVVRYESVRLLFAISSKEKMKSIQFDVNTAYLNSKLKETVYMRIPEGLNVKNNSLALKLNKAIYGLKQSGRAWNEKFDTFIKSIGFSQCMSDKCVYTATYEHDKVYLALYVDDGLIFAKHPETLQKLIHVLHKNFKITACDTKYFVGMEVRYIPEGIFLSQTNYINRILEKFNMSEANPVKTPVDPSIHLEKSSIHNNGKIPYREAVGSLLFLSMISRPDIAFAVNLVSRHLENHDDTHWNTVKRIFRYIKGTKNFGILFHNKDSSELIGFSDADYANDRDTRLSTSGYVFLLNDGCITWSSKRQTTVSLSTTEAEFIAACEATKEAIWLRKLLSELGYQCRKPTTLYVDNQSAIKLSKNPEFHRRTKHIDIKYQFICEKVRANEINTIYIKSSDQCADAFTKPLPSERFNKFRSTFVTALEKP